MEKWLTEEKLGDSLVKIFNTDFIHNKQIPTISERFRPDYRNDELGLVIEFDGPRHYTDAKIVKQDLIRDSIIKNAGYTIIRVPYFVQIESRTIKELFNLEMEWEQDYPHGFNEKNVILPADFCELGIQSFVHDLKKFDCIKNEIIETLYKKTLDLKDIDFVLPPSLQHLLDAYQISISKMEMNTTLKPNNGKNK